MHRRKPHALDAMSLSHVRNGPTHYRQLMQMFMAVEMRHPDAAVRNPTNLSAHLSLNLR
jgi:hypothetical protein